MLEPCNCICHTTRLKIEYKQSGIATHNPSLPCCLCESAERPTYRNSENTLELKQQISELYNEMGKLSMRINENYSKMREFEKQRHTPLLKDLRETEHDVDTLMEWYENFSLQEIYERIEALEIAGKQPSPWAMDSSVCELQKRVEKLETLNKQCMDANPLAMIDERFEKLEKFTQDQVGKIWDALHHHALNKVVQENTNAALEERLAKLCDHHWKTRVTRADYTVHLCCKRCGITKTLQIDEESPVL